MYVESGVKCRCVHMCLLLVVSHWGFVWCLLLLSHAKFALTSHWAIWILIPHLSSAALMYFGCVACPSLRAITNDLHHEMMHKIYSQWKKIKINKSTTSAQKHNQMYDIAQTEMNTIECLVNRNGTLQRNWRNKWSHSPFWEIQATFSTFIFLVVTSSLWFGF